LGPFYRGARTGAAKQGRMTPPTPSPIIVGGASSVSADSETKETLEETLSEVPVLNMVSPLVAPPQASVPKTLPAAPQTRGVPGLTEPAGAGAPPSPVSAPAPQAVAQGPSQSREMMDRLFPMDMV